MIKKTKVDTFQCDFYCDTCNKIVTFTGLTKTSNIEKFVHQCPECKALFELDSVYPIYTHEKNAVENVKETIDKAAKEVELGVEKFSKDVEDVFGYISKKFKK